MGLVKRVVVSLLRPIYKGLFERPLWWFLSKVKAFFFAETMERLTVLELRLNALENRPGYHDQFNGHFNRIEANNAAQWDALERLLLAVLSQPRAIESEHNESGSVDNTLVSETRSFKANAAHNLR